MTEQARGKRVHERWAHFRFSVIGQLLAAPPSKGELAGALAALAKRAWCHPTTGEPTRFGFSTIERWYSAEQIVLRSGTGLSEIFRSEYRFPLRIKMSIY
jgi:hypothetical protein